MGIDGLWLGSGCGCGCRCGSVAVDIGVGVGLVVVMDFGFCDGGGSRGGRLGFDMGFVVDRPAGVLMVAMGLIGV